MNKTARLLLEDFLEARHTNQINQIDQLLANQCHEGLCVNFVNFVPCSTSVRFLIPRNLSESSPQTIRIEVLTGV